MSPTPVGHNLVGVIDRRVDQRERIESMEIAPRKVMGTVEISGAGEGFTDVNFPVWFVEKPNFGFGGELQFGYSPEATNFPTVSVVVLSWATQDRGYTKYYFGARLGIVTSGAVDHVMIVHWSMEGKAMQNPRAMVPGTEDTL